MPYRVKEIFYTLQGEGANTGRATVFCRFSGCNLWLAPAPPREASPPWLRANTSGVRIDRKDSS